MFKKILKKILKKLLNSEENKFKKISYAQCGEDLIIKFIFYKLGIKKPSYIDIGAHHPYLISNTALFHEEGSRGINIEPDPTLFKEFLKYRKDDLNLNIGIGNCNDELDFYIMSSSVLNTFSKEEVEKYSKEGDYQIKSIEKIKVLTLESVLKEFYNGIFPQFLSIDAEGLDEIIIKDIDFENNYPIVICIETISFSTSGNGIKNKLLIEYIESKGYLVYADTHINTIFVRKDEWVS